MTNKEKLQEVFSNMIFIGTVMMYKSTEQVLASGINYNWLNAEYEEPSSSENPTTSTGIKVGDEVTVKGINGIVVREPYSIGLDKELFVLVWYGQHMSSTSLKNVALTGRHFPQITEVLEQLQESEG